MYNDPVKGKRQRSMLVQLGGRTPELGIETGRWHGSRECARAVSSEVCRWNVLAVIDEVYMYWTVEGYWVGYSKTKQLDGWQRDCGGNTNSMACTYISGSNSSHNQAR